jgi:hypothetical protein
MSQPQIVNEEFIKELDAIIERTVKNGSLLISGSGGSGKTFASFWLLRRIMQSLKHETHGCKTLVIDPCLNFRYKFDLIPYIDISETKLLPIEVDLIVDMYSLQPKQKREQLTEILHNDFLHKQQLKIMHNGVNPYENFYILDELHNMVGRYALVGKDGANLLDIITEGRNFAMYFIGVTRRLSDLSTQFVESCRNNLIGKTVGDNDLAKIRKMYGNDVTDLVSNLKPRAFIFYDRESDFIDEIGFPDFVANGIPYKINQNYSNGYIRHIRG